MIVYSTIRENTIPHEDVDWRYVLDAEMNLVSVARMIDVRVPWRAPVARMI